MLFRSFDETRGAVRTFKVERMLDLALLGRTFEPPEAGPLVRRLRSAWDIIADQPATDVLLRFPAAVASRVRETTWHPSQRLTDEPGGSVLWSATVAGTIEIRLWILGWGDDVEVLQPTSLREDVRATLQRALARYAS